MVNNWKKRSRKSGKMENEKKDGRCQIVNRKMADVRFKYMFKIQSKNR